MGCQVDRSPTGSGVTARIALQYHKGLIALNQARSFQSGATGSVFTGTAVEVPVANKNRFSYPFIVVISEVLYMLLVLEMYFICLIL